MRPSDARIAVPIPLPGGNPTRLGPCRRSRNALRAHVDVGALRRLDDPQHHGRARGAAEHDPRRVDVRDEPADVIDLSAASAFGEDGGHVVAIDLRERPGDSVSVQHEVVFLRCGHGPLGPKRSVLMRSAGRPMRSSPSAATSTSAVGPQTKATTSEPSGPLTSFSIASSIRRAYPFQPAGWIRVKVYETVSPSLRAS